MKNSILALLIHTLISTSLFSRTSDSISFFLNNYEPEKALGLINLRLESESENAQLLYLKAHAHRDLFEISEAISAVNSALEIDSLSINSLFLAAELYNMAGNQKGSVSCCKRILNVDSTNMQANFKIANMYYKLENFLLASLHYSKVVESDTTNWYALRRLARSYEKLCFPAELTIPAYYKVLELNSDDKISKHRITMIYLAEKNYRQAVDASNEFLLTDSLNTKILSLNGYGYIQLHEQDSAIASFSKCIELNDTSFFNYKYIGLAYYNKRKYMKSINYLEKAYEINKVDPYTNFYLGASWGRSLDKYKGIDYLNETIELLQPDENFLSKTYAELGKTYSEIQKSSEAGEAFDLAYEYNDRNTDLYFLMGMHYHEKDNVLAKKYLTMYIDSTLANDANSAKSKYYRDVSAKILTKIEEDQFWKGEAETN